MRNKKNLALFIVVAIILLMVMYFFAGQGRRVSWIEHYLPHKKDPFGTSLLYELLQDYFPGESVQSVKKDLPGYLQDEGESGNYVFIGSWLWLDSIRSASLLRFVERGNTAFISSAEIDLSFMDSIYKGECPGRQSLQDSLGYSNPFDFYEDSSTVLYFHPPGDSSYPGYELSYKVRSRSEIYTWNYLNEDLFCEGQTVFTPLGFVENAGVNFVAASYGKGTFLIHLTPLAFTNISLKEEEGLAYAEKVFSCLPPGPVIWDETRFTFDFPEDSGNRRPGFGESPLKYILSQPALAWAWYILLAMGLLYLLFRAKRRQRVIPVLEKNENTSLEFIQTIGRLYFQRSNHRQLALKKMKLFLGFVRDHYHLPTRECDEGFRNQLAVKAEVTPGLVEKIFTMYRNIERSGFASENTLVEFHRALEQFYLNCK